MNFFFQYWQRNSLSERLYYIHLTVANGFTQYNLGLVGLETVLYTSVLLQKDAFIHCANHMHLSTCICVLLKTTSFRRDKIL